METRPRTPTKLNSTAYHSVKQLLESGVKSDAGSPESEPSGPSAELEQPEPEVLQGSEISNTQTDEPGRPNAECVVEDVAQALHTLGVTQDHYPLQSRGKGIRRPSHFD